MPKSLAPFLFRLLLDKRSKVYRWASRRAACFVLGDMRGASAIAGRPNYPAQSLLKDLPPPLSEIDNSQLYPSKSIRLLLVSLFADLSGDTNFIDEEVCQGIIQDAVRALFVIRQELQNVAEYDFGGQKVRRIGDCIHALVAVGSTPPTEKTKSVATARQSAAGLHASFGFRRSVLERIKNLELAIGLELGTTPISRITASTAAIGASASGTLPMISRGREKAPHGVRI